eukprot:363203-Chlamydomonas_euryale.AAC.9
MKREQLGQCAISSPARSSSCAGKGAARKVRVRSNTHGLKTPLAWRNRCSPAAGWVAARSCRVTTRMRGRRDGASLLALWINSARSSARHPHDAALGASRRQRRRQRRSWRRRVAVLTSEIWNRSPQGQEYVKACSSSLHVMSSISISS